jgi:hypothetical protein
VATDAAGHTYPDLSVEVTELRLSRSINFDPQTQTWFQDPTTPPILYFDMSVHNRGAVSLELAVDDAQPTAPTVSQCVSWRTMYLCNRHSVLPPGSVGWNAGSQMLEFRQFARFEVRRFGADGQVDYTDDGLVAWRDRSVLCVMDSQAMHGRPAHVRGYETCMDRQQGIRPGWSDIHDMSETGQNVVLPMDIADGRYALIVAVNPARHLREADFADNRFVTTVELSVGNLRAVTLHRSVAAEETVLSPG